MSYECKFCKKSFGSEKTLITHLCEPKRRWNNRKDKNGNIVAQDNRAETAAQHLAYDQWGATH